VDSSVESKDRSYVSGNVLGRNLVLVASLCVVFFLLGYWVGLQGEITLGRIGKSESLRVVGDMYLGDPVLDDPQFVFKGFEEGLSWYSKELEPMMFEGIRIDSEILYGYQDGKLTSVYFPVGRAYPHETEPPLYLLINLLTERYGEYEFFRDPYGSAVYVWKTNQVYAIIDSWDDSWAEVAICRYDYGITHIAPNYR